MRKATSYNSRVPIHKQIMRNIIFRHSQHPVPDPTFRSSKTLEAFSDVLSDENQFHHSWDTTTMNKTNNQNVNENKKRSINRCVSVRSEVSTSKSKSLSLFSEEMKDLSLTSDSKTVTSQDIDFVSYLQETKSIVALAKLLDSIEFGDYDSLSMEQPSDLCKHNRHPTHHEILQTEQ